MAFAFAASGLVRWLLVLLIGLVGEGVAHGQGGWSGVNSDIPGARADSVRPAGVVADSFGNVTTVWSTYDDSEPHVIQASHYSIQASHYSAATGIWSNAIDLALDTEVDLFPVMAGDGLGDVVAAWITRSRFTRPRPRRVQVARYSAATGVWDTPRTLVEAADNVALRDVVIAGNAGDVIVAWTRQESGANASVNSIQAARYATGTGAWEGPVEVSTGTSNGAAHIAVDAAGNAIAVWCGINVDGFTSVAQAARYTRASGTWTNPTNIAASCGFDTQFAADSAGNAVLVGVRTQGSDRSIVATRYSSNASSWSQAVTLSPAGQHCNRPDVAADGSGNFMAIWYHQTGGVDGVYARRYAVETDMWESGADLMNPGPQPFAPRVIGDAGGNFTAAWTDGAGLPLVTAARRPAGGTWSAPLTVARVISGFEGASLPKLAADPAGNVTLLWSHFHSPASGSQLRSTRWLVGGTPTGPPGAPLNLRASVAFNALSLNWGAPTVGGAPTSYTVLARLTAGGPVVASASAAAATSFNVTAPNGTFVLSVRASNANGTGPESSSVTVTVGQAATPPGPPSNLAASVTGTTVNFTWSAPSSGGAVGNYLLVAGLTPGFSVPFATAAVAPTPVFVVPGVPPGTFYVRVLARNAGGMSAASNEVSFTVATPPPPVPPVLQSPVVSGSTVQLAWSGPAGAAYTLLARATPSGPVFVSAPVGGVTSLTVPGVGPGTYHVSAVANVGGLRSAESNQVVVVVQ